MAARCSLHLTPIFIMGISFASATDRSRSVEMMNETIISNWNNTVGQDGIVFHLGDFCLGGSVEWNKNT